MLPVPLNSSKIASSIVAVRLDQGRGEDGERAALFDVAGRPEELLRRVQRAGVDAAGHDAARGRRGQVVGTRQAGDAVEDDDDVLAHLDEALGLLDAISATCVCSLGLPSKVDAIDLALAPCGACR